MDLIFSFVLSLQLLFGMFIVGALIYFIFKRIEDKQNEKFEDRDY